MSNYTVTLSGPAPWGFRLQGGKDFNMSLTISRITPGSKAASVNLIQGDVITAIDGVSTEGMTHLEAQNKIKAAIHKLNLTMQSHSKNGVTHASHPSPEEGCEPDFNSQEYLPSFNPNALKDSALSTHKPIEVKGPGGKATIIHAQYNTPISMYSQDAIMDAIAGQAQARGNEMRSSLPIKDPLVDSASPVYQAVIKPDNKDMEMSEWARRAANLQSKSFRVLAHITGTEYCEEKFESEVKGPRFAKLKNWHHGLSAQILNIQG
ncbi:hypothetical protein DNTS_009479 [Danionella cerebrum]|uniref:PDZ domain-containing protein n=1 Tax=Danionella cerebrum TaxID=2873325 RepID=A0A553MXD2_9TELE|nr:hypothetical protein DNTS_009479 [Danionella translucida]